MTRIFENNSIGVRITRKLLRLKHLIVLIPLIAFLFLLTQNYLYWQNTEKLIGNLIRSQSLNASGVVIRHIDVFLKEKRNDLSLLADQWLASSETGRDRLFLHETSHITTRDQSFLAIQFIDPSFMVRLSTPLDNTSKWIGLDPNNLPGHKELLQKALALKKPLVFSHSAPNRQNSIEELCVPILSAQNSQSSIQGFISGFFQNDWLSSIIGPDAGHDAYNFQITLNKTVIYRSDLQTHPLIERIPRETITITQDILYQPWSVSSFPSTESKITNLPNTNFRNFAINIILSLLVSFLLGFALLMIVQIQKRKQQLSLSEAHYRSLTESARNYMVYRLAIDPASPLHARVIFVSPSIKDILGVQDIYNLAAWFETIHEDDINVVIAEHYRCMETGSPFECTLRIHHRIKKELRWIEVKASPILNEKGNPLFFNGIFIDVTDTRQSEEKLEKNERLYRNAIELINAVPYYHNFLTNQYDYIGEGIQAIVGFPSEEFTPSLWKSLILEINLLNDHQPLSLEESLHKTQGSENAGWRADYRIKTRSEDDRWIANAAVQVRDRAGTVIGSLGIFQDITTRKRIEYALRESEQKYRELVENANSIILRMDTQGYIAFFNEFAQQSFGYTQEEILGKSILDTLFPKTRESKEKFAQILNEIVSSANLPPAEEFENQRKNGERIWVVWTFKPILNKNGELKEILCIGADVTELKKLQEQFRQAQKMEAIGRLAGGVAHDFNNLLMAIMGFSDLALKTSQLDPALRKDLLEIRQAGERAASLTRQLLAFSRKQILKPVSLNLNQLILNMDKMLRRLIGEDVELVTVPSESLGLVKADLGQMEQILLNLAVNARDAMPKGGKLIIETANVDLDDSYSNHHINITPGPYVLLAVSDSGEGIPKENLECIFDPFFTTKEHGTGLGLSTVYGIVKQSGGHVIVYSEPHICTSFKIYLPRANDTIQPALPKIQPLSSSDISRTILLVEDETTVRNLVSRVLKRYGFTVLEAGYGSEAIELCKQHEGKIHLLISDVIMPKMSGPELATRLLAIIPDLKVLYMSGYTDEAIVQHGILDCGNAFIQKPFTPGDLILKIREIFENGSISADSHASVK